MIFVGDYRIGCYYYLAINYKSFPGDIMYGSLHVCLHIERVIDEQACRLPQETEKEPEGHIPELAVLQHQNFGKLLFDYYHRSLHHHRQECVVTRHSQGYVH